MSITTRVEVDDDQEARARGQAGASGVGARWEDASSRYCTHWQQRHGTAGGRWEDAEPAYRYGHELRGGARYQGRRFEEVETDLQKDWAQRNPGRPWDKARAHVREAWTDLKS